MVKIGDFEEMGQKLRRQNIQFFSKRNKKNITLQDFHVK